MFLAVRSKLFLCVALSLVCSNVLATEKPSGINDQFKFDGPCQALTADLAKNNDSQSVEGQLADDLWTLDNMVKILNSPEEAMDLRVLVLKDAETFRQSIFYNLEKIEQHKQGVANQIVETCGLKAIEGELHLREDVLEEILIGN